MTALGTSITSTLIRMSYVLLISFICLVSCKNNSNTKEFTQETGPVFKTVAFPSSAISQTPYLKATSDNLYLSWQQANNDTLYSLMYSKLEDTAFSAPKTIVSGDNWFVNWADYPVISENNGHMLAHTLHKSAPETYTYNVMLSAKPKDSSWSQPFKLHNDTTQAEHGFVSMLPYKKSQFFVTWLDGRHTVNVEKKDRAMNLRGAFVDVQGTITGDALLDDKICDCCQTTAAMTANGPIVIYRDRSDAEVRDMSIVRYVNGAWTQPKTVHADNWKIAGCPVNGPRADAFNNTLAVAWFTSPNDNATVNVNFSENAGETFQEPVKVDLGNPLGRVDIVLLNDKKAVVSWLEDDKIMLRSVTSQGVLGEVVTISKTSKSRASGFPQLELFKDTIYMAWTTVDEERKTSIKLAKIPLNNFY